MKILDTNIFIDYFREYRAGIEYLESLESEAGFSAITETEIVSGSKCRRKEVRKRALQFLQNWKKIEVDNPIARRAGDIRRENDITINDAIIAATALNNDAKLVTRNVKDFEPVEELEVEKPYE